MQKKISLISDIVSQDDMEALSKWIMTNPRLSKGPLTKEFEAKWSKWISSRYSIYVNSGSSANLLMIYVLICAGLLKQGDEIIVPGLSWSTDIAPLIQFGITPILCDSNESLSLDTEHLQHLLKTHKNVKAVLLVHVLGLVPDMQEILTICEDNNVILLEDCCEAMGSKYKNQYLGTFGLMSTFSMFFSHHISTIEGGMICTNDEKMNEILISIRSHGWGRDWNQETFEEYLNKWGVNEFDSQFTFFYPGFNVRATDLQAFIGLRQMEKLDWIFVHREKLFASFLKYMPQDMWMPQSYGTTSLFAYPIITKTPEQRKKLIQLLQNANIECRPLIAGSMGFQPFFVDLFGEQALPNADMIKECGMFVPCHTEMTEEDVKYICNQVEKLYEEKKQYES